MNKDLYQKILNYLSLGQILKAKYINKEVHNFINNNFRLKTYVYPKTNLDLINKHIYYLKVINIEGDKIIKDDNIKYNKKLRILILPKNIKITDEGLKYLANIHALNLGCNTNITDEGLKYLTNIHTLNLHDNENITDDGLKYLKNIKELWFNQNKLI